MKEGGPAVEARDRLSVDLLEQVGGILGNIIDKVLLKCLLVGERLGLSHSAFGDIHIASAFACEGAHEGC